MTCTCIYQLRPKVTPEVTHSTRSQSMGGEKRPDVIGQKSHDTTPSDDVIPHHDVSSSTSHDKTSSPSLLSKPDETGGVRENQSRTLYDADTSTVSIYYEYHYRNHNHFTKCMTPVSLFPTRYLRQSLHALGSKVTDCSVP